MRLDPDFLEREHSSSHQNRDFLFLFFLSFLIWHQTAWNIMGLKPPPLKKRLNWFQFGLLLSSLNLGKACCIQKGPPCGHLSKHLNVFSGALLFVSSFNNDFIQADLE